MSEADEAADPVNPATPGDDTGVPSIDGSATPSAKELDDAVRAARLQKQRETLHPALAANAGARNWAKGKSMNPGGKPASLPRFRKFSRDASFEILNTIRKRIAADVNGEIPLKELVEAYKEVSDRGGHIRVKDSEDIALGKAKLIMTVMALEGLKEEHREKLLQAVEE